MRIHTLPARGAIRLLRAYKFWISPLTLAIFAVFIHRAPVYAMEVISSFGFIKGTLLTIKRLLEMSPPFIPAGLIYPRGLPENNSTKQPKSHQLLFIDIGSGKYSWKRKNVWQFVLLCPC